MKVECSQDQVETFWDYRQWKLIILDLHSRDCERIAKPRLGRCRPGSSPVLALTSLVVFARMLHFPGPFLFHGMRGKSSVAEF